MKKICIIGAGGILGIPMAQAFASEGYEVYGVCKSKFPKLLTNVLTGIYTHLSILELKDFLVNNGPWEGIIDLRAYTVSDIRDLMCNSIEFRRWFHISTIYVYRRWSRMSSEGFAKEFFGKIDEDSSCYPAGFYGTNKYACEQYLAEIFRESNREITVLRLPFIFGPFDRSGRIEYYTRLIPES
ncbi:MAG: NAD-dependent epimerase/dehydratase family protein [Bacteroidota bacterium]